MVATNDDLLNALTAILNELKQHNPRTIGAESKLGIEAAVAAKKATKE